MRRYNHHVVTLAWQIRGASFLTSNNSTNKLPEGFQTFGLEPASESIDIRLGASRDVCPAFVLQRCFELFHFSRVLATRLPSLFSPSCSYLPSGYRHTTEETPNFHSQIVMVLLTKYFSKLRTRLLHFQLRHCNDLKCLIDMGVAAHISHFLIEIQSYLWSILLLEERELNFLVGKSCWIIGKRIVSYLFTSSAQLFALIQDFTRRRFAARPYSVYVLNMGSAVERPGTLNSLLRDSHFCLWTTLLCSHGYIVSSWQRRSRRYIRNP